MQHESKKAPPSEAYDEERVPFADVMRKLANTKPPHKIKTPVQVPSKTTKKR